MESFRQKRSPGADSFLGLFSQPPPPDGGAAAASTTGGGDELNEDDIFWTGSESPDPNQASPNHPSSMASPNPNPNPNAYLHRPTHRRFPERNFGILAALPEEDKKLPILQRKTFSPSSSSAAASPSSPLPSPSARMIPVISKPKAEYGMSVTGGKMYHQSVPINVPIAPPRVRKGLVEFDGDVRGSEDIEEEEMLPPHEIVARAASKDSPLTTFSMLEGVGRTLKGRDLRRVRNAVWRQTGFLD